VLQARVRLHRRLLQRPGYLRQVLHGRCGLRQMLQEVTGVDSHAVAFSPRRFYDSPHPEK